MKKNLIIYTKILFGFYSLVTGTLYQDVPDNDFTPFVKTILSKNGSFSVLGLDPHSQDVILIPNTPIICKINNKKIGVVNNEKITIKKLQKKLF